MNNHKSILISGSSGNRNSFLN